MDENNSGQSGGYPNYGGGSRRKAPPPGMIRTVILVAAAIIFLAVASMSCWFTVNDKQQAVITTFGKITGTVDAGVHFKLPFGIQKAQKVNVNIFQTLELGYRTDASPEGYTVIEDESKMITGDYNIVNVEFFVEYKVSDPVKYLYGSYEPEKILKNLVQSQVRNVVGSTDVDSVLTNGKESIQMEVRELVTSVLADYDIGLMLVDVKIQDSEPPTLEVIEAFKAVETAKQQAETVMNEAMAYQNAKLPQAQTSADKLTQNALYLKQNRINEAVEQVAMFEAMYEKYRLDPSITRSRMYYEAMSELLPGVRLYIDASDGGVQKLLPIDSFTDAPATADAVASEGGQS